MKQFGLIAQFLNYSLLIIHHYHYQHQDRRENQRKLIRDDMAFDNPFILFFHNSNDLPQKTKTPGRVSPNSLTPF